MISEDILMNRSKNIKGIMKKAIAVILGITMSFGSLALPNKGIKESLPTASAAKVEYEGRKFVYDIEIRNDESGIIITSIEEHGETVKIPSTLVFNGVEYPVKKVDNYFLHDDQTVKTVIFPESVTNIGYDVYVNSSVENITLPNHLEDLGGRFADTTAFTNTAWIKEAINGNLVRFENVLMYYKSDTETLNLKSNELKGIKHIWTGALKDCKNIRTIYCDSDTLFCEDCFSKTRELQPSGCLYIDPMPVESVYKIENVYLDGK